MGDEMSKDLTTATVVETTAIKDYEFAAAEKKEIDAISASITSKTQRIGELAVSIIDAISASIESKAQRIDELAVSIAQRDFHMFRLPQSVFFSSSFLSQIQLT